MGDGALGLAPDFRTGGGVVRLGVVTVGELVQHLATAFGGHALGEVAGTFHALFLGHQHQFGAIGGHRRLALGAAVVGHDQHHLVTLDRRGHGQRDPGVTGGGFDQGVAGLDLPAQLGAGDHRQRRAVFYRTGRVVPFKLEQQGIAGFTRHALQADQGGVADAIGDCRVLQGHGVFAIQTAGANIIPGKAGGPYHAKCGAYGL
ncbi:hypothetical protein PS720_06428 [Pseudomonas fluorescens]|nr:hypothetical protein PS720_05512 [Pseudomonas fluorescens]VVO44957.1 hypothetical protein PS720_06428 [Pseudomonas fluorescens]